MHGNKQRRLQHLTEAETQQHLLKVEAHPRFLETVQWELSEVEESPIAQGNFATFGSSWTHTCVVVLYIKYF